jgi:hypothetical protein
MIIPVIIKAIPIQANIAMLARYNCLIEYQHNILLHGRSVLKMLNTFARGVHTKEVLKCIVIFQVGMHSRRGR